jgi:hypothetical protein
LRYVVVIATLIALVVAGCDDSQSAKPSASAASPTPLQTPNGAPSEQDLRGETIATYVLQDGHPYARRDTVAHVVLTETAQPRPVFLTRVGDAVMVTRVSGQFIPAPGAVFPAFAIAGSPTSRAIVVRYTLAGAEHQYWVFVRYERWSGDPG